VHPLLFWILIQHLNEIWWLKTIIDFQQIFAKIELLDILVTTEINIIPYHDLIYQIGIAFRKFSHFYVKLKL